MRTILVFAAASAFSLSASAEPVAKVACGVLHMVQVVCVMAPCDPQFILEDVAPINNPKDLHITVREPARHQELLDKLESYDNHRVCISGFQDGDRGMYATDVSPWTNGDSQ